MTSEEIQLLKSDITYALSSLAYVVADVRADTHTAHSLHQAADICAEGNIDRVDSLLRLYMTDAMHVLGGKMAVKPSFYKGRVPEKITLSFTTDPPPEAVAVRVRELLREFLVTSVLGSWLRVTLPEAADVWKSRAAGVKSALSAMRYRTLRPFRRAVPPI